MGLAEAVKFRSFNRVGKRALCLGSDLRQPSSAKHFHKMLAGLTHGVSSRSWLGRAGWPRNALVSPSHTDAPDLSPAAATHG